MISGDKFKIVSITTSSGNPASSILIIYTGGTFGMVYDKNGHLIPFNFSQVVEKIPELHKLDLKITVISFPIPVDSSNIKIVDWQNIGHIVESNYEHYDGFVVLHGTDTMAYSASALSFMLDGLNKPVIFTGAQIPIGATRSDARENLITALEIASKKDENGQSIVSEVCVYFNHFLLRGNRSQKVRSSNFAAFESENYPFLAESGVEILFNHARLWKNNKSGSVKCLPNMDNNVTILKLFPDIPLEVVRSVCQIKGLSGMILESFGSGNVMNDNNFIALLKEAVNNGLIVLNVSQCLGGSVIHGQYETSKQLSKIGVISGYDITTEASVTKMMHLLANENSIDTIKEKLSISLRGELTV